ncbi:hypothetical protein ACX40Y_17865 [Sphingomonas sp. RS6]
MATDDRRMHEGRSRSLDDREPRNRANEAPRSEGDSIGVDQPPRGGGAEDAEQVESTTERHQESVLGGHVATRSRAD